MTRRARLGFRRGGMLVATSPQGFAPATMRGSQLRPGDASRPRGRFRRQASPSRRDDFHRRCRSTTQRFGENYAFDYVRNSFFSKRSRLSSTFSILPRCCSHTHRRRTSHSRLYFPPRCLSQALRRRRAVVARHHHRRRQAAIAR